jgi:hypothetical protein
MQIFFDTEFTGLHRATTLISIGMVAEDGHMFYAEFTDYDQSQVFDWLQENVIDNLWLHKPDAMKPRYSEQEKLVTVRGDSETVAQELRAWLSRWERIDFWADIVSFDWILFCDLLGGIFKLPANINFIPFDICTLFKVRGIDPTINRENFAGIDEAHNKHNALYDAIVVKACYEKLISDFAR